MTDRPILFSTPMVRALLAGTKTQTRRLLKEQPPEWATFCQQPSMLNILHQWVPSGLWAWSEPEQDPPRALRRWPIDKDGQHYWLRPRIAKGDRLWVRENAAIRTQRWHHEDGHSYSISYRADENGSGQSLGLPNSGDSQRKGEPPYVFPKRSHNKSGSMRWQPSIHMPRRASRLTLTVTDVRIERLQDISEADAIAEGCKQYSSSTRLSRPFNADWKGIYRQGYAELWNEINGDGSWEDNPWIVAYTFTVHHCNIDQMAKEAA